MELLPYPWEGLPLIGVLPWATRLVELLPYTREALPLKGVLPWATQQPVHEATKARLPCGSVAGVLSESTTLKRTRAEATCSPCALAGVVLCVGTGWRAAGRVWLMGDHPHPTALAMDGRHVYWINRT